MITVSVLLPEYLYQWALHNLDARVVDGRKIVFPVKGSPLSHFLRNFLRHKFKKPDDSKMNISHGAIPLETEELLIQVPHFPGRDPEYYNYLSFTAEAQLRDLIRSRFDLALFTEFSRFDNVAMNKNDFIFSWLDANGIDQKEKNWLAVDKRLQLLNRRSLDRKRKMNVKSFS